jgi:hypothetical protein
LIKRADLPLLLVFGEWWRSARLQLIGIFVGPVVWPSPTRCSRRGLTMALKGRYLRHLLYWTKVNIRAYPSSAIPRYTDYTWRGWPLDCGCEFRNRVLVPRIKAEQIV